MHANDSRDALASGAADPLHAAAVHSEALQLAARLQAHVGLGRALVDEADERLQGADGRLHHRARRVAAHRRGAQPRHRHLQHVRQSLHAPATSLYSTLYATHSACKPCAHVNRMVGERGVR